MRTMNDDGREYPFFKPSQILSADELNESFNYLNEQGMLTRANLVGTGVVYGLDVRFEKNKVIISKGYGVTSGGNYIYIEQDISEFGYYKETSFACLNDSSFPAIRPNRVYELLTEGREISNGLLDNKVVILVYKTTPIDSPCGSCGNSNFNGSRRTINIHALLLDEVDLSLNGNDLLWNRRSERRNFLSAPTMPRFVEVEKPQLLNYLEEIKKCIKDVYIPFNGILQRVDIDSILADHLPVEKFNNNIITQNHYNFLCDLIEAYEEFRECGEKVLLDYRPAAANFPCHLILNGKYRHHFRPATASDDYSELNRLWERLVAIIQYFNETPPAPAIPNAGGPAIPQSAIRLTPSIYGAVPLSEKAVPYYYYKKNGGNEMPYTVWNSKRENPLGYWYKKEKNGAEYYHGYYKGDNWKNYDLEQYNFVRIEGHLGVQYDIAKKVIEDGIGSYQLPIEIIELPSNSIETESHCISSYQKRAFGLLKLDFTVPALVKNLYKNIHDLLAVEDIAEFLATDVADNDLRTKANKVIQLAKAVKDSAKAVKDLITGNINAATNAAENAAENARASVTQAVKDFQEKLIDLNDALKVPTINDTVKEIIIDKRDKAAAMTTGIDIAMNAISARKKMQDKKYSDLERYLTEEYVEIRDSYEAIALAMLFKTTGDDYKKISSFLQWLDTTRMTYQQCEAKKVFSSFESFRAQHPGLQHKSGVPIGGTFILVHDGSKVIADFCLPYRVTQPD